MNAPSQQRIFVAGGSGKLGTAVIDELVAAGYIVHNLDLHPPTVNVCGFMRVDFNDYGQCVDALRMDDVGWPRGDALIHLAAIPGPFQAPDAKLFANNMQSTFNLWRAAGLAGIRNIVWASSETLLGVPFNKAPVYVPLDERVSVPQSSYALEKHLEEEMARQLCLLDPTLKLLGLRFSYAHTEAELQRLKDQEDQRARDPRDQAWNLWSYISTKDAARAVRLALDLPMAGTDQILIANSDTIMPQRTRDLMAQIYPGVPVPASIGEHQSLIDCSKAKRVLGWTPREGWRQRAKSALAV